MAKKLTPIQRLTKRLARMSDRQKALRQKAAICQQAKGYRRDPVLAQARRGLAYTACKFNATYPVE